MTCSRYDAALNFHHQQLHCEYTTHYLSPEHLLIWSCSSSSFSSHLPGFFLVGGWLQMSVPRWALCWTEPETIQPGAGKLHGWLEPPHHYLLSASHIHKAKGIQELQFSTKPSFIQSWWSDSMWVCCKSVRCSSFSVWWQEVMSEVFTGAWGMSGVFVSWVELELECGMDWRLQINTSFTPVPSLPHHPDFDTPCLHAWWPSTSSLVQTGM